jgi:ubiquinone/menaquinone biosynthesis C-methylase UbiE
VVDLKSIYYNDFSRYDLYEYSASRKKKLSTDSTWLANMRTEPFGSQEMEKLYNHTNPIIRSIFRRRVQAAHNFATIDDNTILLDIGCGTGHLLKSIRRFNDRCECWGTDIIKYKGIELVNCKFQVADVRNLPFNDNHLDIVFALDILEHIGDDVDVAMNEIYRVLNPDGIAILSGPTESWFYRFCRSLLFYQAKRNGKYSGQEIDYHYHNVYDLEQMFLKHGFRLIKSRSLPGLPLPSLFRVSKFQKSV